MPTHGSPVRAVIATGRSSSTIVRPSASSGSHVRTPVASDSWETPRISDAAGLKNTIRSSSS